MQDGVAGPADEAGAEDGAGSAEAMKAVFSARFTRSSAIEGRDALVR
jgi:hypothetical protein